MNEKPIILVSSDSGTTGSGARELRSPAAYTRAVAMAGAIPVIGGEHCAEELAQICDGLLLSGGPDIEPDLFGEEIYNDTVSVDTPRTKYEYQLLEAFLKAGKPIFGICRGEQLISVYLGGDMYQDLAHQRAVFHSSNELRHSVTAEKGSFIEKLFGSEFMVNSTHHQAVRKLGKGLVAAAHSKADGIIEAYYHEILPIIATQWHPERLTNQMRDERTPDMAPLFSYFIEMVKNNNGK